MLESEVLNTLLRIFSGLVFVRYGSVKKIKRTTLACLLLDLEIVKKAPVSLL
jgi:hypothetical protein